MTEATAERIASALERQVEQTETQMARNTRWRDENMKLREADLQRQLTERDEELAEARRTINAFTERIDALLSMHAAAQSADAVDPHADSTGKPTTRDNASSVSDILAADKAGK